MHWGMWAVLCAGLVFSASCKGDQKSQAAAAPIPDTGEISASADDLIARRDALLAMRGSLVEEREALIAQRETIVAEGGDTSEVDDKLVELMQRESELDSKQSAFFDKLDEHLSKQQDLLSAVAASGGTSAGSTEAAIAARERDIANRESRLAERESALAEREESLATKWKESCEIGAPQTIIQTVDAKGSKYTEKDVEPLLKKARREMSRKGILSSDLPNELRGLEDEAAAAMKDADYLRARLAANTLYQSVRGIKIDKAFIAAKIARLNQVIGKRKVDGNVDSLFREATAKYGDGEFAAANKRLNNIYAAIR